MAILDIFRARKYKKIVAPVWNLLWSVRPQLVDDSDDKQNVVHLRFIGSMIFLTYLRSAEAAKMAPDIARGMALTTMKQANFNAEIIDHAAKVFPDTGKSSTEYGIILNKLVSGIVDAAAHGSKLPETDSVKNTVAKAYSLVQ